MWLATKLGFFSIVATAGNELQVRTRWRQDLENLKGAVADRRIRFQILRTPGADYEYRAIVTRPAFRRIQATIERGILYGNFKAEIQRTPGQEEKHDAYERLWGNLLAVARFPSRRPDRQMLEAEARAFRRTIDRWPDIFNQPSEEAKR